MYKPDNRITSSELSRLRYPRLLLAGVLVMSWLGFTEEALKAASVQETSLAKSGVVKVWEEQLTLPTYRVDPQDKNPIYFRNQVYQGAKKKIYRGFVRTRRIGLCILKTITFHWSCCLN